MKFFNILLLLVAFTLMGNTGCDAVKDDAAANPGKYIELGKGVYTEAKDTDLSGSTTEDVKSVVDTANTVVGTIATVVPGAQGPGAVIVGVLTFASTVLGWMVTREKKKVKVVTEEATVNKARADNYATAIESGINEGQNQKVIDVVALEKGLDQDTKNHFNGTGAARI